jgi:acetyltransferase-like isoleucine patch superfamily enzyme
MKLSSIAQRFLFPAPVVTLYYLTKYRCKISPKAEVELSPFLTIGKNTVISSFTKIKATYGSLNIGANVLISTGCFIGAREGGVRIGDNCMIGPNTSIIGNSYKYDKVDVPIQEQGITSKGIKIGNNVWIGAGTCVVDGTEVGSGVIVAPNSVVSSRIPENTIIMGNPAKVIFKRR